MRNVARCWTYETGVILGQQMKDELPFNSYFEFFGGLFASFFSLSDGRRTG